ncbi:hypothetical protein F01_530011 [Burkholderia cenocepacia]|nr:hypothetical protein F01_530011 [Burkholderia cenocepacia]
MGGGRAGADPAAGRAEKPQGARSDAGDLPDRPRERAPVAVDVSRRAAVRAAFAGLPDRRHRGGDRGRVRGRRGRPVRGVSGAAVRQEGVPRAGVAEPRTRAVEAARLSAAARPDAQAYPGGVRRTGGEARGRDVAGVGVAAAVLSADTPRHRPGADAPAFGDRGRRVRATVDRLLRRRGRCVVGRARAASFAVA